MPTKIAWLSFPARNHRLTLRMKLANAAAMKKYLLCIFFPWFLVSDDTWDSLPCQPIVESRGVEPLCCDDYWCCIYTLVSSFVRPLGLRRTGFQEDFSTYLSRQDQVDRSWPAGFCDGPLDASRVLPWSVVALFIRQPLRSCCRLRLRSAFNEAC